MSEYGILYIATGEQYVKEAIESAHSLVTNTREYPMTLITDKNPHEDVFDNIQVIESQGDFADKIRFLRDSPYERTVFLDTDTYVCGRIADLFELLDRYPLAAAHAPGRRPVKVEDVPECFPEFNTGVLCYRSSDQIDAVFSQWLEDYEKERDTQLNDQPAFRRTIYASDIRVATLPPEYNCRTIWPGYVDGPVKILHGRHENPHQIAKKLNRSTDMRVFLPDGGDFAVYTKNTPSLFQRALRRYHQDGFSETIRRTINFLK